MSVAKVEKIVPKMEKKCRAKALKKIFQRHPIYPCSFDQKKATPFSEQLF